MKKLFLSALIALPTLAGFTASAQHKPTLTVINNTSCTFTISANANGCPGIVFNTPSSFQVAGGTTAGPSDATSFSWYDPSISMNVTPNPFTISWNSILVLAPQSGGMYGCNGSGASGTVGSLACGSMSPVYSLTVGCPLCTGGGSSPTASITYSGGDATVTIN
ncbi:MAG: hypothetical protein JWQ38_403 [Flavipsychrobacter sp.]|nr:hypothetical protein [Flavipsychrobacter sp.]